MLEADFCWVHHFWHCILQGDSSERQAWDIILGNVPSYLEPNSRYMQKTYRGVYSAALLLAENTVKNMLKNYKHEPIWSLIETRCRNL